MSTIERRKSPRIDTVVPIKLSDQEFDALTETCNISATGAYCPMTTALEPMTKLNVVILLPVKKNNGKKDIKKISCTGVVVRCQKTADNPKYPFRIAIYFNDLKDQQKKTLFAYINPFLKA